MRGSANLLEVWWERPSSVRDGDGVGTQDEGNDLGEEKVEADGVGEGGGLG